MTLRSLTAVLAAAVGTGGLLAAFVVRDALWLTVQACVVDATLTGARFLASSWTWPPAMRGDTQFCARLLARRIRS